MSDKLSTDALDDLLRISMYDQGGYGFATDIQDLAKVVAELAGLDIGRWERHPETGEWRIKPSAQKEGNSFSDGMRPPEDYYQEGEDE